MHLRSDRTMWSPEMKLCCSILLALCIPLGLASAHHSSTMFDHAKTVVLVGEIKEFNWNNPHCSIVIEVPDDKGNSVEWNLEGGSPNEMIKVGWRRSSLKPGDKVTIAIHPLRNGAPGGSFARVTLADGTVLRSGYLE
jgi:hypothetical protein